MKKWKSKLNEGKLPHISLKDSELLSHDIHYLSQAQSYLQEGDIDMFLQHMNHRGFLLGIKHWSHRHRNVSSGGSHFDIANSTEMLWGEQGKRPGARCGVTLGAAGTGVDPFGTTSLVGGDAGGLRSHLWFSKPCAKKWSSADFPRQQLWVLGMEIDLPHLRTRRSSMWIAGPMNYLGRVG